MYNFRKHCAFYIITFAHWCPQEGARVGARPPQETTILWGFFLHVKCLFSPFEAGACPGICKGGGAQSLKAFFFFFFFLLFNFSGGGGPAQKLAEKMTITSKKVAKYR